MPAPRTDDNEHAQSEIQKWIEPRLYLFRSSTCPPQAVPSRRASPTDSRGQL